MHFLHCFSIKTPRKKFGHPFVFVTFCPYDTASYESFNERPEGGRFSVFVGIASEDVGDDFRICWDELGGRGKYRKVSVNLHKSSIGKVMDVQKTYNIAEL